MDALLPGVPWIDPAEGVSADLVLLAVPDDVLGPLVAGLAPHVRPGQLLAHTCGSRHRRLAPRRRPVR